MIAAGLTALGSLDGSPIDPDDARVLDLEAEPTSTFVVSTGFHPALDHARRDDATGVTAFLGRTVPSDAYVRLLDLASPGRVPADRVPGDWVTVTWEAHECRLHVRTSAETGAPLYLATDGTRVALAPTIRQLARLSWIGHEVDAEALMYGLGRAPLRERLGARTFLGNVWKIAPNTQHEVERHRHVVTTAQIEQPFPWRGSFDGAVAHLRRLLEAGVSRDLSRHRSVALELSGGLDSSALGWLIAGQRRDGQDVVAMTSVAPPTSAERDDRMLAAAVAERLGFDLELVSPAQDANVYRPTDVTFELHESPLVGPRHYLYAAFDRTAADHRADATFNGMAGEFSLTRPWRLVGRRERLANMVSPNRMLRPDQAFHPRVRDHVLASCPTVVDVYLRARGSRRMVGYIPGWDKLAHGPMARLDGTARYTPFRNPDAIAFAASLPPEFFARDGYERAIVRAMTAGGLPDIVRLRTDKTPFSPDYYERMRRDAPRALARLDHHRTTAAADWLDLDWLEGALSGIEHQQLNPATASEIQVTAMTAEWFDWWDRQRQSALRGARRG